MLARASVLMLGILLGLAGGCRPQGATARPSMPPSTDGPKLQLALDGPWMRGFVERFSADAMGGRYTLDATSIGNAASVLTTEYATLGLAKIGSDYRVPFDFASGTTVDRAHHVWIEANAPARALPPDQAVTLSAASETTAVAEVTFAGARALAKPTVAVRERIVLIRDPLAAGATPEADHADLRRFADRLAAAGARALIVVGDRTAAASTAAWPIPVIALRPAGADALVAAAGTDLAGLAGEHRTRDLAGVRLSIAPRRTDKIAHADNVLAWIPGTDAKAEIVLIGAHYDHIGTSESGWMCRGPGDDTICNGADDNASGTAVVLAIAKAMTAAGYRPRRTIVFAHFAGEELGLHGSKALANKLPATAPFLGARVVAMVNFDMVGRLGKAGLWVGGVGSSNAWMPLLGRIGDHGIPTVYERSVTARSDHASFYQLDIPVLFFFTGMHDDYHRPGDEVAALNFDGMQTIGDIALALVVALGDGEKIAFAPPGDDDGLVTRMPGSDARTVAAPPVAPAQP